MKLTKLFSFAAVLFLAAGCLSPGRVTETEIPTQPGKSEISPETQPPTPAPGNTATPSPTETPTQTPTQTPTETQTEEPEPIEIDIQATYTAIAIDYESRLATMMPSVLECETAPRVTGWRDYHIEEVGLHMQLPQDWSDMDYRTYRPNQSKMFQVKNYGVASSSAGAFAEGIELHIWYEEELELIPFIKDLREWAARNEFFYATLFSPLPHENSLVNGHPASIAYVPEYDFGEQELGSFRSSIVIVTKMGDYVIMVVFNPRANYDPTETLLTMLSSLSIDDVQGGETVISETVLCQSYLHFCLRQCGIVTGSN